MTSKALLAQIAAALAATLAFSTPTVAQVGPEQAVGLTGDIDITGLHSVDWLNVPEGVRFVYDDDTHISSAADIVINGELVGRVSEIAAARGVDAPQLILESASRIIIKGVVQAPAGMQGNTNASRLRSLGSSTAALEFAIAGGPNALDDWVESLALPRASEILLPGGAGGDVVLRAPVIYVDGMVIAGSGGRGGVGSPGGHGGSVIAEGPVFTWIDDSDAELLGGVGGVGGLATPAVDGGLGPRGGNGGDAFSLRSIPEPSLRFLLNAPSYASAGSNGANGADAFGADGGDGADGIDWQCNPNCTYSKHGANGGDGGHGGDGVGGPGEAGGDGSSGCPSGAGDNGGTGGRGGRGAGGDGGNGGDGGTGANFDECCGVFLFGCSGGGGDGGNGGDGTGGDGADGGDGGNGCPAGLGAAAGAGGRAMEGVGGTGGQPGPDGFLDPCVGEVPGDDGDDGVKTPGQAGVNGSNGRSCAGC